MSFCSIRVAVETNTDVHWIFLDRNRPHLSPAYMTEIIVLTTAHNTKKLRVIQDKLQIKMHLKDH